MRISLSALLLVVPLSLSAEKEAAFDASVLKKMERSIEQATRAKKLPGAVLWLEHQGSTHHTAIGRRSLAPEREDMTLDTIFDAASLTKVVATTPSVLRLIEQGKIGLSTKVARHLPEFRGDPNKSNVTVRQLLTHTSGLLAGIRRGYQWEGAAHGIALAAGEVSSHQAGFHYRYSDLNFILLGELVRRVSGQSLDAFASEQIFTPLKMRDTGFRPKAALIPRIAPTTRLEDGSILRGTVHDPTSRAMGGVAGHAGLFTTAEDLARFARMLLNGGELDGIRILNKKSVALMTSVQSPPSITARRGLGFDIDSPYAGPRGDRFPIGSYGHTGWTGTSLWIDPFSRSFVILLSNRNHPSGGNVLRLRQQIGSLAARAISFDFTKVEGALPPLSKEERKSTPQPPATTTKPTLNGIDVLRARQFRDLKGLRVGLITNQTGRARDGTSTIDLLHNHPEVKLVALFGPEHGIRGTFDGDVKDGIDKKTGLPIHSLYGGVERRIPQEKHLQNLDALVFDMQDIGCRFFTYISTMGLAMEAAQGNGLKLLVLDRVNPIGGTQIEGPLLVGKPAFVAFHTIPLRHGMTMGELALLFRSELYPHVDLNVVPLKGWDRSMHYDATGLPWIRPSPNMPSLTTSLLYPGLGMLEFTNLSVGRGTALPFELVGAPYIDESKFAERLNAAALPGLTFIPVRFTPTASKFMNEECGGVRVLLKDRRRFSSTEMGLLLAESLRALYPDDWKTDKLNTLIRHPDTIEAILQQKPRSSILDVWQQDLDQFAPRRQQHLLYR